MEEEFKKLEQESKWEDFFLSITKKSRTHSFDSGESGTNRSLNRYLNVLPYDRSRVKLKRCADDTDYINANLVTVPKAARQYILTQEPLPETLPHFWLMVWEQRSHVIVMLNKCLETQGFVKCEKYWPDTVNSKVDYDSVGLNVTLMSVEVKKHFIVREMLIADQKTNTSRTISQFQYTAWPDYDQPDSPTSFLRLLAAIRKSGGLDKMDEPTIVHCSAGIGRSGTFCLIDSVLSMIENQGSAEGIDVTSTLLDIRDYRMGLIQSPIQLRFAYMSIIYGIKILENASKIHHHMSSVAKTNGSTAVQTNGIVHRRNKKKVTSNSAHSANSLNVFNKQQFVEALDDIDSDTAESLFEESMKQLPNLKKPRNTEPDEIYTNNHQTQMLSSVNPLLTNNNISQKDSVLLQRRERELKNQRLAERTQDIKNRMKAEELRKELLAKRVNFLKKSALFGGLTILVSSIAYMYLNGN